MTRIPRNTVYKAGAMLLLAVSFAAASNRGRAVSSAPAHQVPLDVLAMTYVELGVSATETELRGVLATLRRRWRRRPELSPSQILRASGWGWEPVRYGAALDREAAALASRADETRRRAAIAADVLYGGGASGLPFEPNNFVHPARIPNEDGPRKLYDATVGRWLPNFSVGVKHVYDYRAPDGRWTRFSAES